MYRCCGYWCNCILCHNESRSNQCKVPPIPTQTMMGNHDRRVAEERVEVLSKHSLPLFHILPVNKVVGSKTTSVLPDFTVYSPALYINGFLTSTSLQPPLVDYLHTICEPGETARFGILDFLIFGFFVQLYLTNLPPLPDGSIAPTLAPRDGPSTARTRHPHCH
jgi:hypothetical protein